MARITINFPAAQQLLTLSPQAEWRTVKVAAMVLQNGGTAGTGWNWFQLEKEVMRDDLNVAAIMTKAVELPDVVGGLDYIRQEIDVTLGTVTVNDAAADRTAWNIASGADYLIPFGTEVAAGNTIGGILVYAADDGVSADILDKANDAVHIPLLQFYDNNPKSATLGTTGGGPLRVNIPNGQLFYSWDPV